MATPGPHPARELVVLTCMDARVLPLRIFDLDLGDAHVVRNAGGRMTDDAIRSIVLSTQILNTREVIVMHHTRCGLHGSTDDDLRTRIAEHGVPRPDDIEFLPFTDVEQSVRDDITKLTAVPYLPAGIEIWGAVYDLDTGEVHRLEH